MGSSASVVGATGLVGTELVLQLCADPAFDTVHLISRRRFGNPAVEGHAKVRQHIVDFDRLAQLQWPHSDVLFCCLGTTLKAAGSRDVFRAVDYGYVVEMAKRARESGTNRMMVISALGADPKSRLFYNRIKGEMEAALTAIGFEALCIFRPSLLTGHRSGRRPAERTGLTAMKYLNILLPAKYRPVPATAVARAMVDAAKTDESGVRVIESNRIQAYVQGAKAKSALTV